MSIIEASYCFITSVISLEAGVEPLLKAIRSDMPPMAAASITKRLILCTPFLRNIVNGLHTLMKFPSSPQIITYNTSYEVLYTFLWTKQISCATGRQRPVGLGPKDGLSSAMLVVYLARAVEATPQNGSLRPSCFA